MTKVNYRARDVAKYIVLQSEEVGRPASNLRLQKLLYFVQVASYDKLGKPLFNEEFEAWHYGPVLREVYRDFAHKGAMKIRKEDILGFDFDDEGKIQFRTYSKDDFDFDEKTRELIDYVVDYLKDREDYELVNSSHTIGPWKKRYNRHEINMIRNDDIKEFVNNIKQNSGHHE